MLLTYRGSLYSGKQCVIHELYCYVKVEKPQQVDTEESKEAKLEYSQGLV